MAPTNASGPARLPPACTAPTSRPMPIEKRAGSKPRRTSTTHQAIASGRSAFGRTAKNLHSLRARKRRNTPIPPVFTVGIRDQGLRPQGRLRPETWKSPDRIFLLMRTLFIGGTKRGYLTVKSLVESGAEIAGILSLKQDEHERERYELPMRALA